LIVATDTCAGYFASPFQNQEVNMHAGSLNATNLMQKLQRKRNGRSILSALFWKGDAKYPAQASIVSSVPHQAVPKVSASSDCGSRMMALNSGQEVRVWLAFAGESFSNVLEKV
jgi:hypothetical protein